MISLNYFDSHGLEIYHCALMFLTLPHALDPFQAAEKQARFQGQLPLARLERVAAESQQVEGETVTVDLEFSRDARGRACVNGELATRILTTCQRCLQPLWLELQARTHLHLLRREGQADEDDTEFEPLVVDEAGLDLLQLVDEELLLNLPLVATHPEGECSLALPEEEPDIVAEETPRDNPFAILAALKDSNKHDQ